MALHVETPLVESIPLGRASRRKVYLKLEAVQPAGSFKIRGIGALCEAKAREGARRLIAPSGGNAGYAAAWAAMALGLEAQVIVPRTTSVEARNTITSLGAKVVVHGSDWDESNSMALLLAKDDPEAAYIHPFDDPLMWEGHATMIDEAARQGPRPDAIVLSVGGGGLLCGTVTGMDRNGWGGVSVITAETEGADCFFRSLKAGKVTAVEAITSVATSLGARAPAPKALEFADSHSILPFVGSDLSAVAACRSFLDDHRILVEPACGIALSVIYENREILGNAETLLVIVCGGIGISASKLASLSAQSAEKP